jgi:hypothetical protein
LKRMLSVEGDPVPSAVLSRSLALEADPNGNLGDDAHADNHELPNGYCGSIEGRCHKN